ncbi:hypothetical protein BD779DRAFT_567114 [Infundibulicybe gibba]|nr:hypothetical protein BD779DRAFT_567114 [Infundibulicybe gibba]
MTAVFPPSFPALVVVGAIAHSSVQAIYTHRFYIIPGCWGFPAIFWTLSAYTLGSAVAYTVIWVVASSGTNEPALLDHWNWVFTSHLSVAAGANVLICISTCWCLARPSNSTLKRTQQLVNRIMLRIIQTGLVTSMMSICVAITFATCQPRAIWMGLYFPLIPLYPVTLLTLLNGRASIKKSFESPSLKNQAVEPTVISRLDLGGWMAQQRPSQAST